MEQFEPQRDLEHNRIVLEDSPSNEKGEIVASPRNDIDGPFADAGPSCITFDFVDIDRNETLLRLRHEGLPVRMHDDCVDGWTSALGKLKAMLETH